MADTMMDKYGRAKVRQVVSDFYGRVLESPRLSLYFDGVDIHTLVAHQSAFLEAVMGGLQGAGPDEIRRIHARLDVPGADFEEMIDLLGHSLDRFEVEPVDKEAVQGRYLAYADQVVTNRG